MINPNERNLCIVDVCGTLVRDDTTLGLLHYHFANNCKRRFRKQLFSIMTARPSPILMGFVVLERLTGKHLLKHALVRLLKGDNVADLDQSAAQYAEILLKNHCVQSVWSLIEQPPLIDRILLASASLEPIVASLASKMGVRHVASKLEQKNGVLTGRYANDLTGLKEQAILDKYGENTLSGRVIVISDNFSDRPLLAKASQAFVVLHKQAHKKRWQGLKATYLDINK